MPIFVFYCKACNQTFESLIRPHEPVHCPVCKASHVDKIPAVTDAPTQGEVSH